MSVPMPNLEWIPSQNCYDGRLGYTINNITFHHVVGSAQSAINKFLNYDPVNGVSSHFVVGPGRIVCMVDTDNGAWTNGYPAANCTSVTIEFEGTWLNGFRNEATINSGVELVAWLMDLYPNAVAKRHRDFVGTSCPGDFPVEEVWNKAAARRAAINAPVPPPDTRPLWLKNRVAIPATTKYAKADGVFLYNLDTLAPADARRWVLNQKIENLTSKTTIDGKEYFITQYSTSKNIGAGFWSGNLLDAPYVAPVPDPDPTPPEEIDPEAGKNWAKENNGLLQEILVILKTLVAQFNRIFK